MLTATLVVALPARAHHSYAAFDDTRTRTLQGTVKTFNWANPHVAFKMWVDPDGGGEPQEWSIETRAPAILARFGWTRTSLKRGDRISVACNVLKDGSHGCHLLSVVMLETGKRLEIKSAVSSETRGK